MPSDEALPGDSAEQREAELAMLEAFGQRTGTSFEKHQFSGPDGIRAEVDGYSSDPLVFVEAWAHQGPPKSAQKAKVMTDAAKLLWLEKVVGKPARKVILFSDDAAAAHFRGRSWMAAALKAFGFEIVIEPLQPRLLARVLEAQRRQYR